ncbi:MAG: cation:proton antiporter [Hyphomicrobiaceae bacterium]
MAAGDLNIDAYIDALLVLGTAGVVVPLVRRFGGSPVLGYLAAGALLGPLGLGSLKYDAPLLLWLTVADSGNVSGIAELGVVFLMFLIGLELSPSRLVTMRRLVFGLGGLQVVLSAGVLASLGLWMGWEARPALIIGLCLALSSTAMVLDVLSGHRRLAATSGRVGFAVLLAQDLAVVPLFLLIAVLSATDGGSVFGGLLTALLRAALAMLAIIAAGRFLLRPLLRLVASVGAPELFTAATLFVVVASGVAAAISGLSMALGAFVAGLMLAETEYRKAVEVIIEPFKALLLGVFFFTIGMKIDFRELLANPAYLIAAVGALIGIKTVIAYGLMRVFRVQHAGALEASLLLGPGGEFAFVGIGLAVAAKLVAPDLASFVLAVASLSMALIPLLYHLGRGLTGASMDKPHVELPPEGEAGHAIIVGYGRFGRLVSEMLAHHGFSYLAIDSDPSSVAVERQRGKPVYYGDAVDRQFLERCGLANARALVITVHDQKAMDQMVISVREQYPDLTIVARARDATHARHLYGLGVTDAVPETIEASLQLSEAVLVDLGIPAGPVIASIHEKRDEFRHALQEAAQKAGQRSTRGIKSRTLRR